MTMGLLQPWQASGNPSGSPAPERGSSVLALLDGAGSTGTSGHKLPYLDGNNTWAGTNEFSSVAIGHDPLYQFILAALGEADDYTSAYIQREDNFAGGDPENINSALTVQHFRSAGVLNGAWAIRSIMDNSATFADGRSGVAIYAQSKKRSTGATWALLGEAIDYAADPQHISAALELNNNGVGTDTNFARRGIQYTAFAEDGNHPVHATFINIDPDGDDITTATLDYVMRVKATVGDFINIRSSALANLIKLSGSNTISGDGIDLSGATISGAAFKSAGFIIDGPTGKLSSPVATLAAGTITASAPNTITQTWNSGATVFTGLKQNITDSASDSTSLLFDFQVGGVSKIKGDKTGSLTSTSTVTSGASLIAAAASQIGWAGRAHMVSGADGVITLFNDLETGFTRLNYGGVSASFPAWSRSGTTLAARLADDSAAAAISALSATFTNALLPSNGGTGVASYAVGDLLYASGATTLSKLADVATGNALISGGLTTAPAWGKIGLTTHISGILAGANGGTGNGFAALSGPTTSLKTFALPDASATILTSNAPVTVAQGGTSSATAQAAAAALKVPYVVASSGVAVPLTGSTGETTLATIAVPANAMGANGTLRITSKWSAAANNVNAKTIRIKFGGTTFLGDNVTSRLSNNIQTSISNRAATNSQIGGGDVSFGGSGTAVVTTAIDTTSAQNITLTGQLGNSGDTMTLESYLVELILP